MAHAPLLDEGAGNRRTWGDSCCWLGGQALKLGTVAGAGAASVYGLALTLTSEIAASSYETVKMITGSLVPQLDFSSITEATFTAFIVEQYGSMMQFADELLGSPERRAAAIDSLSKLCIQSAQEITNTSPQAWSQNVTATCEVPEASGVGMRHLILIGMGGLAIGYLGRAAVDKLQEKLCKPEDGAAPAAQRPRYHV